jgi:hypothetical protein
MTLKRVKKRKKTLSPSPLSLLFRPAQLPFIFPFLSARKPSQAAGLLSRARRRPTLAHLLLPLAQHRIPLFFFGQATGRWGPADRPSFYLRLRVNRAPSWLAGRYRPPPPCPSPSTGAINLAMKLPLHSPSLINRYPLNPPPPLNSLSRPAIDGHGRWGTASLRHPEPI